MEAFMGRRCPFACDVCGSRKKREVIDVERSVCEDVDPTCEEMATEGMCTDPVHQIFMEKSCPFACDVCSDRKRRRARAIADLKRTDNAAEKKRELGHEDVQKRGCQDYNSKCEQYAVDGLCHDVDTVALMTNTCPSACDRCKRHQIETRAVCKDVDPTCEEKAIDGFCFHPDFQSFMEKSCAYACDVCSGVKKRRARAIAELRLDAVAIDAAAAAADGDAAGAAKRSEERRMNCEDYSPKCESFAMDGLCGDAETAPLMAKTCPFACEQCKREMTEEVAKKEENVKEEEEEAKIRDAAKREVDELMGEAKKEVKAAIEAAKKEEAVKKEEVAKKEEAAKNEEAAKKEEAIREVRAAMAEEKALLARSFAGLLADAADAADAADVAKRSCRDFSPKCGQYASAGLCRHRETFSLMTKTCPSSCGRCVKREISVKKRGCTDKKTKCEAWATHGMCTSDPDMKDFMSKTCPFACDLC